MYAQINEKEVLELAKKKASGLATQIYLVLSSHCWKKNECFPSMARIKEMLGGVYHINSIHRALKWLEDNDFIVRHARTSSSRFVMKVRALTKKLVPQQKGEHKRERKRKNNYRYSNTGHKIKKSKFQNESLPSKTDAVADWVDRAIAFIYGETKNQPGKANLDEVKRWMLGGQNAASMFWPDITKKLGHLLV